MERAPEPMHGRVVAVEHDGSPLFAGIPSPFEAVRYHSLALTRPLPGSLRETATCDGVPMALEHRDRPQWGVQFHPESIATEHGARMLANFRDLTVLPVTGAALDICRLWLDVKSLERGSRPSRPGRLGASGSAPRRSSRARGRFRVSVPQSEYAFWLDSSRPGERGRFSFMGDASGPLAEVIMHKAGEGKPLLDRLQRRLEATAPRRAPRPPLRVRLRLRRLPRLRAQVRVRLRVTSQLPPSRRGPDLRRPRHRLRPRAGARLPPLPAPAG